jgi:hypothetical protein
VTREALLSPIVDARSPERAYKKSQSANYLVVIRKIPKTTVGLPKGIVIVNKRYQVSANLTTVEGSISLSLKAIEQGLRSNLPQQDIPQRCIIGVTKHALCKAKV